LTSDITLSAPAEDFRLHKFLLSARSPYFMRKFADAPETVTWKLPHAIPVEAFRVVLRYLYLGDLPRDFVGPASAITEEEVFRGIDKLCKHLEIEKLWEAVLSINDRRLARQRQQDEIQRAQEQVEAFFHNTVVKHRVEVDTRKAANVKWPHHNAIFADCLLRADYEPDEGDDVGAETLPGGETTIPIGPVGESSPPNAATSQKSRGRSVLFPVHKPFLIRSPYFETMFSSDFLESHETEHLHIIKVDCTPAVLEIILRFLYTEKTNCPLEHALDLLYTADMLLLDKLKTKAAVTISTLGSGTSNALVDRTHSNPQEPPYSSTSSTSTTSSSTPSPQSQSPPSPSQPPESPQTPVETEPINVYDVIRAAWDLKVQRLEEFAARYLANRLEDYIDEDEFAELIRESADRLEARQETDTIELLDDIRYYLSERFRFRFEGAGLEEMLHEGGGEEGVDEDEGVDEVDVVVGVDAGGGEPEGLGVEGEGDGGEGEGGGMRTLDGDVVEDEFASDAVNYQILIDKIDKMLERLELSA
jgi:hypothetical protein